MGAPNKSAPTELVLDARLSESQQRSFQKLALSELPKIADIYNAEVVSNWVCALFEQVRLVQRVPEDKDSLHVAGLLVNVVRVVPP